MLAPGNWVVLLWPDKRSGLIVRVGHGRQLVVPSYSEGGRMPQARVQMQSPLAHARSDIPGESDRALSARWSRVCVSPIPSLLCGMIVVKRRSRRSPWLCQAPGARRLSVSERQRWPSVSSMRRSAGDAPIERACSVLKPRFEPATAAPCPTCPTPPLRRKPHSHRKATPAVHPRAPILRIPGVARVAVPGIRDAMAQTMLPEMGTDMSTWPDDQHGCSGLGLAPNNDISGGTVLRSRTMQNRHPAAHAFRLAAPAVIRAACASGACYHRLQGRLGPTRALVATAHQMARTL